MQQLEYFIPALKQVEAIMRDPVEIDLDKEQRREEHQEHMEALAESYLKDEIRYIYEEGALSFVDHTIADPAFELSQIYQMVFDGMAACDIGLALRSKINKEVSDVAMENARMRAEGI